jgi:hypothetical protein
MLTTVTRKNNLSKSAIYAVFVVLLLLFSFSETRASMCCVGGDGRGCCGDPKLPTTRGKIFKRTFRALQSDLITQTAQPSIPSGSLQLLKDEAPVITYEDIKDAYKIENGLIYYSSPDDETYSMNLGTVDLVNPQHWILPDCEFNEEKATGIALEGTPYAKEFSDATHCKLYTYEEDGETYECYEYYNLNQTGATLLGSGDDFDEEPFIEHDDLFLAPFPLDKNFNLSLKDTIIANTHKKITEQSITVEGFGTLTTPWGDVEVLKIVNNYKEWYYKDNVLKSQKSVPVIQFISKGGYQCEIDLEENSPTTGEVTAEFMDFTRITTDNTGTNVLKNNCVSSKLFTPNPSSGIIKFNVTGDYEIFNVKGTKVKTILNAKQANLSNLPKGTYLIKGSNCLSQKLILR